MHLCNTTFSIFGPCIHTLNHYSLNSYLRIVIRSWRLVETTVLPESPLMFKLTPRADALGNSA